MAVELLRLDNVTIPTQDKKKTILRNVSFTIEKGAIHAIIGPNGSGKSTLANTIMGLSTYNVSEGQILFNGVDITNYSITDRAKLGITLSWQEPARITGLSVEKYISLGLPEGLSTQQTKEKVLEALDVVNLNPDRYINRMIDESLSGGERKRVEFAAAVAMRPQLIILDEPTAGLDMIVIEDFLNIFKKIKKLNMTILLITHREDIGMVADTGTLLWDGDQIVTGIFGRVMVQYCAKAGLKEFCKRTIFKDGEDAGCFDDDYIERIFEEEELKKQNGGEGK